MLVHSVGEKSQELGSRQKEISSSQAKILNHTIVTEHQTATRLKQTEYIRWALACFQCPSCYLNWFCSLFLMRMEVAHYLDLLMLKIEKQVSPKP